MKVEQYGQAHQQQLQQVKDAVMGHAQALAAAGQESQMKQIELVLQQLSEQGKLSSQQIAALGGSVTDAVAAVTDAVAERLLPMIHAIARDMASMKAAAEALPIGTPLQGGTPLPETPQARPAPPDSASMRQP